MRNDDYDSLAGCLWGAVIGPPAAVLLLRLMFLMSPAPSSEGSMMASAMFLFFGAPFLVLMGIPAGAIVGAWGPPVLGWSLRQCGRLIKRRRG